MIQPVLQPDAEVCGAGDSAIWSSGAAAGAACPGEISAPAETDAAERGMT